MNITVWVVTGSSKSPDVIWGVHTRQEEAELCAVMLQANDIPAIVEIGHVSIRGA